MANLSLLFFVYLVNNFFLILGVLPLPKQLFRTKITLLNKNNSNNKALNNENIYN